MRRAVLLAGVLGLLLSGSASAASVSGFYAERQGGDVAFHVIVCGARGYMVSFQEVLTPDSGGPEYLRRSRALQRQNCKGWEWVTEDIWEEELFDVRMTVVFRGSVWRSDWSVFDNGY